MVFFLLMSQVFKYETEMWKNREITEEDQGSVVNH